MKRYIFLLSLIMLTIAMGCKDQNPSLTEAEIDEITRDAPQVVVQVGDRLSLEGLEGLYLGQPQDEALEWMEKRCNRFVSLEGGIRREESTFKGCDTPKHEFLYSFRVGFTGRASDRVFTLELKRRNLEPELVRARFAEHAGEIETEVVRPGITRVETARHKMYADWDEGAKGPTHILVGLSEEAVSALNRGD